MPAHPRRYRRLNRMQRTQRVEILLSPVTLGVAAGIGEQRNDALRRGHLLRQLIGAAPVGGGGRANTDTGQTMKLIHRA